MLLIPKAAYDSYLGYLKKCSIDEALFPEYVKWLRYYLDFCGKHLITETRHNDYSSSWRN